MTFDREFTPRFAIGAVIVTSLRIVSHNLFRFGGIILAVVVPVVVLSVLGAMMLAGSLRTDGGPTAEFAGNPAAALFALFMVAVALLAYFLIQAAITYGALQTLRGATAGIGDCLRRAFSTLPRLFFAGLLFFIGGALVTAVPSILAVSILRTAADAGGQLQGGAALGVGLGLLLILAVALYIVVLVWVFVPAIVVEGAGPVACFRRSFALTKGRRWPIFGIAAMLFLANFGVSTITKLLMQSGAPAGGAVLNILAAFFFIALTAVLSTVGYYYLRAEKEGVAIEDVVRVFD